MFYSYSKNHIVKRILDRTFYDHLISCTSVCLGICSLTSLFAPGIVFAQGTNYHFERATQYEFAGDLDSAVSEYRKGLELSPDSVDGHTKLGTLLLDGKGDLDGAISEFLTALSVDPECHFCQSRLDEAVAKRNASPKDSINRGNDFYRAGQLTRAAAAYKIAVRANSNDAEAHNCLSWTLYRLGKLEEGLREINFALKLKPDEPEYVNTLACIQYDLGSLDLALANWKKAIAKSKSANPADFYGLAIGYLSKGDTNSAVKNFKEAVKSDPNYASLVYLRDKIGMSVHALSTHDKLLELSDENNIK